MSKDVLKILVCGDVDGKFKQFFSRVSSVNKKNGPFEMVFCVGNFFGDDNSDWMDYASGIENAPIVTYILGPCKPDHVKYFPSSEGCEICPNVVYLGKKGILTGSSGLKVAYVCGNESKESKDWTFTLEEVGEFQESVVEAAGFKGVDILLTSHWPRGVTKYAKPPDDFDNANAGSELIAKLSQSLIPRYHFAGLEDINYERLPYRNHRILNEKPRHCTRFVSLAKVGNIQKRKWLYAFSIVPLTAMNPAELTKQPPDVTECPYLFSPAQVKMSGKVEKSAQFFYDLDAPNTDFKRKKQFDRDQPKRPRQDHHPKPMGPCWFCLGSPEVEKHLVISVGDYVYLAFAKGALVPDHVLLLPIGHYQSMIDVTEDVLEELEKYKTALRNFYKAKGKSVVFYERNFKSPHLQIQVIPVPSSTSFKVKEVFLECGKEQGYDLDEIPKHTVLKQVVKPGRPYFYVELPNREKLFHRINKNFSIHFGREVLAAEDLLNLPGKADWKNCSRSKEEESSLVGTFRKEFQNFDFTLIE